MRRFVPLLELDADLGECIPPAELADALRLATVPVIDVPAGPCDLRAFDSDVAGDEPYAALVTAGLLVQNVALGERIAAQLIGPGDVVVPWGEFAEPPATGLAVIAAEPARLAILDWRLLLITRRWPQIGAALLLRSHQQAQRTAVQHAISQLSRVEDRVLATLWHLAQRWGTVTPPGTVVSLGLTHAMLGRLVGARRPTVTLALTALTTTGLVVRRPDGRWLLPGPAADRLQAGHSDRALLARISALRESEHRMTERVQRSLRLAEAVREQVADTEARVRAGDPDAA